MSIQADPLALTRDALSGAPRPGAVSGRQDVSFATLPRAAWDALYDDALELNAYQNPDWLVALASRVGANDGAHLLSTATPQGRATGVLAVQSLWRTYRIPLPALVSWDPFSTCGTPMLDKAACVAAVREIMESAAAKGAHAILLRGMTLDGAAMQALRNAARDTGVVSAMFGVHRRAALDATGDADAILRASVGAKRLKELRRLRHRLGEKGDVSFRIARTRADVAEDLETFLALEASGWKGHAGSAMAASPAFAGFIRDAAPALAARGRCEIALLRVGDTAIAGAIILRHGSQAFFFKIGIDERFARFSPGVQLTLDLTRHFCADPRIAFVDSTAAPDHPMIDSIWRERIAIGDVLLPLRARDPVATAVRAALATRYGLRAHAKRALKRLRR